MKKDKSNLSKLVPFLQIMNFGISDELSIIMMNQNNNIYLTKKEQIQ